MAENNWYVYLLECRDGSVYTGVTNDVTTRMEAHKCGKGSKYVARKGFKRLLHVVSAVDKVDAMKMEYRVKQMARNEKVTFFVKHPDRSYSVLD
ncbi:MAG: GIY-YIG nuclease family protein [Candidatus Woesearchaeota archaeon]